jgi:Escherichia/Staphylococcus phage prohead protease
MNIEIRNDSVLLSGIVNTVLRESRELPSPRGVFREIIAENVFTNAIKRAENVNLLLNHQESRNLGSLKDGNLELYESAVGLHAKATITDKEVVQAAKDNRLSGWSFGFCLRENGDSWEVGKDGVQRRTVKDMDLHEISILDENTLPAYPACSVEVRNDSGILERRYEKFESNKVDYSTYENEIQYLKLKGSLINGS